MASFVKACTPIGQAYSTPMTRVGTFQIPRYNLDLLGQQMRASTGGCGRSRACPARIKSSAKVKNKKRFSGAISFSFSPDAWIKKREYDGLISLKPPNLTQTSLVCLLSLSSGYIQDHSSSFSSQLSHPVSHMTI